MASANVDLVRSICARWERGDYGGVDWEDPRIEFVIADGPTPGTWIGASGISEGWGAFLSAWEGFHTQIDEYRELDAQRVFVRAHFGGRGKSSGLKIAQMHAESAAVFHIRDGKVTRLALYFDGDRAVDDLALAYEPGTLRDLFKRFLLLKLVALLVLLLVVVVVVGVVLLVR